MGADPPEQIETDSGLALDAVYRGPTDPRPDPGSFPFVRGIRAGGYRERLWTMRQYAGFGTAAETNQRFRQLLGSGQTGISVAFDLPTQMGLDSDSPRARGEVGRVGVAIDSLADMETLLDGLPLDQLTTSMTINATAPVLLLLYQLAAERRGISAAALGGTVQNDILKEYAARGTYIYPPRPSMRLVTDTFVYARRTMPRWNPISISGYHMREAGATAVQEIAFTLANGVAYLEAAVAAGLEVDDIAPRLSFFFNVNNDLLEEVAKFRAARLLWAGLIRDRFGSSNARSQSLRFHAQTGGATLTAQQPLNNVVRVTVQALAAVLGGAQSLHTNSYDEALALPSEHAAEVALRTQQVLAYESGVARVADPMGGSHLVESLTDRLAAEARQLMARVDDEGGAVAAIEAGMYQREIEESAYRYQQQLESGARTQVGVNRFTTTKQTPVEVAVIEPQLEADQVERLASVRAGRDDAAVRRSLDELVDAARGDSNLLEPMRAALAAYATIGEVSDGLRSVFGVYHPDSAR